MSNKGVWATHVAEILTRLYLGLGLGASIALVDELALPLFFAPHLREGSSWRMGVKSYRKRRPVEFSDYLDRYPINMRARRAWEPATLNHRPQFFPGRGPFSLTKQ